MLIGIYSPQPQSGKSVVGDYLRSIGFKHLSMAEPVKMSLLVVLNSLQVINAGEYLYGDWKGLVIPELGVTGGQLMSTYAMAMRDINPDIWLNSAKLRLTDANTYIDDLRFQNEYDWLRSIGGITIKVVRPDITTHNRATQSEGQLDSVNFDYTIVNDGNLDDLYNKVKMIPTMGSFLFNHTPQYNYNFD